MEPEDLDGLTSDEIAAFDPATKNEWISAMHARVGIDRARLANELREKGPAPKYSEGWTPENPTFGYCAVVTVAVKRMLDERESKSRKMRIEGNYMIEGAMRPVDHYFLVLDDGGPIIDLTADQVDYPFPYVAALPAPNVGNLPGGVRTSAEDLYERLMAP